MNISAPTNIAVPRPRPSRAHRSGRSGASFYRTR